eukprot:1136978-Pelagomonas_calceolata.AAC.1
MLSFHLKAHIYTLRGMDYDQAELKRLSIPLLACLPSLTCPPCQCLADHQKNRPAPALRRQSSPGCQLQQLWGSTACARTLCSLSNPEKRIIEVDHQSCKALTQLLSMLSAAVGEYCAHMLSGLSSLGRRTIRVEGSQCFRCKSHPTTNFLSQHR